MRRWCECGVSPRLSGPWRKGAERFPTCHPRARLDAFVLVTWRQVGPGCQGQWGPWDQSPPPTPSARPAHHRPRGLPATFDSRSSLPGQAGAAIFPKCKLLHCKLINKVFCARRALSLVSFCWWVTIRGTRRQGWPEGLLCLGRGRAWREAPPPRAASEARPLGGAGPVRPEGPGSRGWRGVSGFARACALGPPAARGRCGDRARDALCARCRGAAAGPAGQGSRRRREVGAGLHLGRGCGAASGGVTSGRGRGSRARGDPWAGPPTRVRGAGRPRAGRHLGEGAGRPRAGRPSGRGAGQTGQSLRRESGAPGNLGRGRGSRAWGNPGQGLRRESGALGNLGRGDPQAGARVQSAGLRRRDDPRREAGAGSGCAAVVALGTPPQSPRRPACKS